MKSGVLNDKSSDKLSSWDVASRAWKMKTFYVGDKTEKLNKYLEKQSSTKDSDTFLPKTSHCLHYCGCLHPEKISIKQSIT